MTIFNAGVHHFLGGQTLFAGIVSSTGSAVGTWVAANAGFMFPLVFISMWLTGLSLIFGIVARLGSVVQLLFAIFFILGLNSWIGNIAMLAVAIGFIIVGPGRYYGVDSWLLEKVPGLRFLA